MEAVLEKYGASNARMGSLTMKSESFQFLITDPFFQSATESVLHPNLITAKQILNPLKFFTKIFFSKKGTSHSVKQLGQIPAGEIEPEMQTLKWPV